jgi:hypothetical protein
VAIWKEKASVCLMDAVETETGDADYGELDRQDIAPFAAGIVTGSEMDGGDFTIREGGGVEAGGGVRVFVEPKADDVLGLHDGVVLCGGAGRMPLGMLRFVPEFCRRGVGILRQRHRWHLLQEFF